MKYFKKEALKGIIGTIGKGLFKVADKGLTGGLIHNVVEETKEAKKGVIDVNKVIRTVVGSTIPVLLLIALFKGWITIEQLNNSLSPLIVNSLRPTLELIPLFGSNSQNGQTP